MNVRKRIIKGKSYYYLEHSLKEKGKVIKKERYLGKSIPKNINKIKTKFQQKIMEEKYYHKFEEIKKYFNKELKSMPISAKKKYLNYFMIKFTYDTNRIEGSTITLKETAKIIEKGITPKNKPIEDIKGTEAHRKVFYEMINYPKDLSLQIILQWHKTLLQDTHPDIAGKMRTHQVKIAGSKTRFPIPAELNILLREFVSWYNKNKNKLHPLELATLTHLKFVSIHPFTDGNGRISRLLMNFILNKHDYPMLNIKYSNRDSYYNSLEKAQTQKTEKTFTSHIFKRYLKEYTAYYKQ